ncbi:MULTISPECIES: sulfate ABC transporter permease subunit CysW [Leptolyngbya]|jgi:sulfate transport system permease protein|uniref:Sulfate ABC transporter, inner membrane subunit CysW n=2 Tax=Leptolyngbya boryana TaxID=1184 RepID=A0A1Z4JH00_LEPBY|nr:MULTISPECIES: sulfate ABC transporter permease subunit CysW [Leptolyngbya]BAY56019.1 sulfate ABC transporter, inner membrane subunit CysW [Leptolyngbya boryana NIES-2135]MBD1857583.1 sulfate ABC transporter permease subunit CysW [Leptolyngbya sp. FACHB-1624]MBD2366132.1 sulfate ABC transporter permease subunit CysW [Leptolyngbya sp. FACHB-161]MBD2372312.1 sulfate ABC transporter permease subunit CysW [Leptolyngbya sp. FACHB-238]MBD2396735.1 sulfate ABC transporter permease subunit CysW [Lep
MSTIVSSTRSRKKVAWVPAVLITIAIAFLALIIYIPAINVFYQAFKNGVAPFLANLRQPNFMAAVRLTIALAAISVPLNIIFGLCTAWALARKQFRGRALLLSIIDLPFAISPVVAGLMLVLLYGRNGWFGPMLNAADIKIIFAFPGMVLATMFVSLPFVAREVIPVLDEIGPEQEEAASTLGASHWQTFWRVTLPSIRWGLLYGVILTNARAMGEFGAVSVVSGNLAGKTQSLPLFIEEEYKQYATESAYSAAVLLALLAVVTLIVKEIMQRKSRISEEE